MSENPAADTPPALPDAEVLGARPRWRRAGRWLLGLLRFDTTGLVFAAFFFCWSLTPSLLPRDWMFQGLIGGLNAAIGYGFGVVVGWAVNRWILARQSWWPLPQGWLVAIRLVLAVLGVITVLSMLIASAGWQRELAVIMESEGTTTTGYIRTGLVTLLVAAVVLTIARVLRDLVRWVAQGINRFTKVPQPVATTFGAAIVAVLFVMLVNGVLVQVAFNITNRIFSNFNDTTAEGIEQPTASERSGSPASLAEWDTLGYEGRNFVARGWDAEDLATRTGAPAKEPVRAYVGLESAPTAEERMDLLMAELKRTGAFERAALILVPSTGTGWVNPTAAQAVELLYGGDTAIVAAQYSYQPSAISFLADRPAAAAAGKMLVERVQGEWARLPEATRPKLFVYGESLGTQSGEGAFDSLAEIRDEVDGVLWVGPPNSNRLWGELVKRRDPGSPMVRPQYSDGLVVRFANNGENIDPNVGEWLEPRVLYLQHASDPVVWWSTKLLFQRPDWLREAPGQDRLPSMRWFPIVTFWQVSADLGNAAGVTDGHGHNYGTQVLDGWAAVAAPDGWTSADTERTRVLLRTAMETQGPEK
ncbi:alpha/beta hydrolase [Tomitella biformata]|uniref:alpha/beta hydrolase n=1 Tax=Tomitella biformata TaxID=630403 RepID=UPI000463B00D|nr:alpha/beta-hydrolase family protein [Tomitella biformata]